jgi:hypothetical protein
VHSDCQFDSLQYLMTCCAACSVEGRCCTVITCCLSTSKTLKLNTLLGCMPAGQVHPTAHVIMNRTNARISLEKLEIRGEDGDKQVGFTICFFAILRSC